MVLYILGSITAACGLFIILWAVWSIKRGEYLDGTICDIVSVSSYRASTAFCFVVKSKENGLQIVIRSSFVLTLFKKIRLENRKKKYVGKPVHIYYIDDKKRPNMSLIKEFLWKEWLCGVCFIAFGILMIFLEIYS